MSGDIQDILKIPELPVIEIVDDLVQVYKEFMVVNAALKLDLFSWMAENGPATPEKIALGTGIRTEYITSLLGMLYYLDMVRRSGEEFAISPAAKMHFVRDNPFYQGDYIMNLQAADSPWKDLDSFLTKPEEKKTFDTGSSESIRADANQVLRGTIQNVIQILKTWERFSKARTCIDISGGHGLYAIAACQANPAMSATVLTGSADPQVAEEYISRYGMETRIKTSPGDMMTHDGPGSDIVLIAHAFYPHREDLDTVLSRTASCLNQNGLLLSNHWFASPPVGSGMQGLYELELEIHNRYHQLPDKELFERLCQNNHLVTHQTGVIRSRYGESTIHMMEKR